MTEDPVDMLATDALIDLLPEAIEHLRAEYLDRARWHCLVAADRLYAAAARLAEMADLDLAGLGVWRNHHGTPRGMHTRARPIYAKWMLDDAAERLDPTFLAHALRGEIRTACGASEQVASIVAVEVDNAEKALAATKLAHFRGGPFAAQTG